MKISFIDWFVCLFIKGMKEYPYDKDEKEKIYLKIRSTENTKKEL